MDLLNKLLDYYHLTKEDYQNLIKEPSFDDIPDPFLINDMQKAKDIIFSFKDKKEKVMVYGDYDADGILSTSIVVYTLKKLGIEFGYYIPSRYIDRYGINVNKVHEIYEKGYRLLITVDNGISANEALDEAKKLGMTIIIIDHHEYSNNIPCNDAIIHQDFSLLPKLKTSAGFLSFLFSKAILGKIDFYLFTLGCISIVTDLMPLLSYNRNVLRLAFKEYPKYTFTSLSLLFENNKLDENTIHSYISPKINAVGRVILNTNINRLVKFFVEDDYALKSQLNTWINNINEEKRKVMKDITNNLPSVDDKLNSITLKLDCKEGYAGIFANRFLNKENKITCIFTDCLSDPNILVGSIRSKSNVNIIDFYESSKDILLTYGGHKLAGGVSIKKEDFSLFKDRFEQFATNNKITDKTDDYISITFEDITLENCRLIQTFSPFGEGFKEPNFYFENILYSLLKIKVFKGHSFANFPNGASLTIFNCDLTDLKDKTYINFLGTLNIKEYMYKKTPNLMVNKVF